MTTSRLTLSEQFFRDQAHANATGGLSTVLNRFSLIGRMLASEIMRAGFVGLVVLHVVRDARAPIAVAPGVRCAREHEL